MAGSDGAAGDVAGPAGPGEPYARRSALALAEVQARQRVPAVVAAVRRDGAARWSGAVGAAAVAGVPAGTPALPAGADVQMRIGSITKTFTAVLVMQARDAGLLSLDDLLDRHVPGSRHGGLSLRRLLAHRSGVQREPAGADWTAAHGPSRDEVLAGLDRAEAVLPPGRRFHYSNLGFALLGEVVARVRGMPWEDALARHLLQPLDLRRVGVDPVAPRAVGYFTHPWLDTVTAEPDFPSYGWAPAGQLWATADDLARWGAFLADPDGAVLSPGTVEEMTEPQVMRDLSGWTGGYGLGLELWRRGDAVYVGHGGAMPGFLAGLAVRRADRVVAATLTNAGVGADMPALAVDLVADLLAEEPTVPAPWQPQPAVAAEVAELVGVWWSEGTPVTFAVRDGVLTASGPSPRPGVEPSVLEEVGPDRWRVVRGREAGEYLDVRRDETGRVASLFWAGYPATRDPRAFADG